MAESFHLVATPIGNLDDMTFRAVRVLREADVVACEDTRRTRGLLAHFEIQGKALVSCHEHNEQARATELVARVDAGEKVALVSDAGMPAISDPGYRVVRAMIAAGHRVEPIPGASAVETALVASGLPTDSYRFCGFLPARRGQRQRALEAVRQDASTLVFFEAPHRIRAAMADLVKTLGDREVAIARELTKMHEEVLRGPASELQRQIESCGGLKGEIVVVVAGAADAPSVTDTPVEQRVAELMAAGASRMEAIKEAARERGLPKRELYQRLEAAKTGNV